MSTSCAETRYGGMTVRDAFPDERVAAMVKAASRGDLATVDAQIRAGADANYIGTDGITPLLWVMVEGRRGRDLKGAEHLLIRGANPNYQDAKDKVSAMSLAAGGDSPELLELLLKHKGDPNLLGDGREMLLQIAIGQMRRENLELLLRYGADINAHVGGSTAGTKAAAVGRFDIVAYLLERGLTYDLQGLAEIVELRRVPPESEGQRRKDKVIEMLKARGVKFPAFVPRKPQDSSK